MKKIFAVLLCVLFAAPAYAACGGKSEAFLSPQDTFLYGEDFTYAGISIGSSIEEVKALDGYKWDDNSAFRWIPFDKTNKNGAHVSFSFYSASGEQAKEVQSWGAVYRFSDKEKLNAVREDILENISALCKDAINAADFTAYEHAWIKDDKLLLVLLDDDAITVHCEPNYFTY